MIKRKWFLLLQRRFSTDCSTVHKSGGFSHQICQHSSQPRCLSWSYSLFPTANFLRFIVSAIFNFVGLVQYATICLKMSPKKLLYAFVLSRLGYCNSLLAGCPKYLLSKLPKVQNNVARLIFRTNRSAHVTPMLHSLHWLPIEQRIKYKLSLLCFKIISHQAPIYLSELLHLYTPSQ